MFVWLVDSWWYVDDVKEYGYSIDGMLIVSCFIVDMKEFVSGGYFLFFNVFYGIEWIKILSGGIVG